MRGIKIFADDQFKPLNDYILSFKGSERDTLASISAEGNSQIAKILELGLRGIDQNQVGREASLNWKEREILRARLIYDLYEGLDKVKIEEYINSKDLQIAMQLLLDQPEHTESWYRRGRAIIKAMECSNVEGIIDHSAKELGYSHKGTSDQTLYNIFEEDEGVGRSNPNTPPEKAASKSVKFNPDLVSPQSSPEAKSHVSILKNARALTSPTQDAREMLNKLFQNPPLSPEKRDAWEAEFIDIIKPLKGDEEFSMRSLREIGVVESCDPRDLDIRIKYLHMYKGVKLIRFRGERELSPVERYKRIRECTLPQMLKVIDRGSQNVLYEHIYQHLREVEEYKRNGQLDGVDPQDLFYYLNTTRFAHFAHFTDIIRCIGEYIDLNVKRRRSVATGKKRQMLLDSILLFLDSFKLSVNKDTLDGFITHYEKMTEMITNRHGQKVQVAKKRYTQRDYYQTLFTRVESVNTADFRKKYAKYLGVGGDTKPKCWSEVL